jgi:hypothetical protein
MVKKVREKSVATPTGKAKHTYFLLSAANHAPTPTKHVTIQAFFLMHVKNECILPSEWIKPLLYEIIYVGKLSSLGNLCSHIY